MRDLREGVKLKKVQERQYNPLPIEYQLTPYEMLMDDIRSKRYKLRKVMVSVQFKQHQSWIYTSSYKVYRNHTVFMPVLTFFHHCSVYSDKWRHPTQVKEERP